MSAFEKRLDLIKEIEEIVARDRADQSTDYQFSRAFSQITGRPEGVVLSMVRDLADRRMPVTGGRYRYASSIAEACKLIWDWYKAAALSDSIEPLRLIEYYDRVFAWVNLIADQNKEVKQ